MATATATDMATARLALVVGINYERTPQAALRGCVNDARAMRALLEAAGYRVRLLTDDAADGSVQPTAAAIVKALVELIDESRAVEGAAALCFHFSGHGVSVLDREGDESDGRDEALVGSDSVAIRDDLLHRLLASVPSRHEMAVVVDACHSGSVCDLAHVWGGAASAAASRVVGARVVLLSACLDAQTAAEMADPRPWVQGHSGAMTSALLFCLRWARTWPELLKLMRFALRYRRLRQRPQLSSSFALAHDARLPFTPLAASGTSVSNSRV